MYRWSGSPTPTRPPVRYRIDDERNLLLIDLLELRDVASAFGAIAAIPRDKAFRRSLNVYVDCGYLHRTPAPDELRALARVYVAAVQSGFAGLTGRRALVAGGTWI